MPTYAIVETGGKQYRVEKGQSLLVDRISEEEGANVPLRAVMFRSDEDTVLVAKDLEKVKVEAKVAGHERGEKVKVFKYKAKKGYRKRQGHRSELTRLEVTEVAMLTRKPAAKKKAEDAGELKKADEAKPKKAPAKKAETEKKAKSAEKKAPAKKAETEKKAKSAAKKAETEKKAKSAEKKAPAKKPAAKSESKPAAKKKAAAKKPAKTASSKKAAEKTEKKESD